MLPAEVEHLEILQPMYECTVQEQRDVFIGCSVLVDLLDEPWQDGVQEDSLRHRTFLAASRHSAYIKICSEHS